MQNAPAAVKIALKAGPLAYGIKDFAAAVGISSTKIYEEIKSGRLRAKRIGGRTIISADDAAHYLSSLPALPAKAYSESE
jgi:excisionase family DNA binding protein